MSEIGAVLSTVEATIARSSDADNYPRRVASEHPVDPRLRRGRLLALTLVSSLLLRISAGVAGFFSVAASPLKRRARRHARAAGRIEPRLICAVEEAGQRIEVLGGDRVVLVVVAARATDRHGEEPGTNRDRAIDGVLDAILLVDGAVLIRPLAEAEECRCQFLLLRRVRQQVAGELPGRERSRACSCFSAPMTQSR